MAKIEHPAVRCPQHMLQQKGFSLLQHVLGMCNSNACCIARRPASGCNFHQYGTVVSHAQGAQPQACDQELYKLGHPNQLLVMHNHEVRIKCTECNQLSLESQKVLHDMTVQHPGLMLPMLCIACCKGFRNVCLCSCPAAGGMHCRGSDTRGGGPGPGPH